MSRWVALAVTILLLAGSAAAQEARALGGHTGPVASVAWSPDGTKLASGSLDKTIRIWDNFTGLTLRTLTGHADSVLAVSWSPDGTRIASGSKDRTVRVWDASTGALLRTLEGHTDWVGSVAWSPDGTRIASGSKDGTIRIWDASTGSTLRVLDNGTGEVLSVAWSPDGTKLASGSGVNVLIWDLSTGSLLRTLRGHTDSVASVAWSPYGTRLASGSFDKTVRVWDVSTGSTMNTFTGHTDWVLSVAWSPDGSRLASGSFDSTIRIRDLATGSTLKFIGYNDPVRSIALNPDGNRLASGSGDSAVHVWDATAVPTLYSATVSGPILVAISSLLVVSVSIIVAGRRRIAAEMRSARIPQGHPTGGLWARWEALLLVALLSASLALRLALSPTRGYVSDLHDFAVWHSAAATNLSGFYNLVRSDYPPLNILVFSLLGRVEGAVGLGATSSLTTTGMLFLKLPQNLVDLAIPVLLYAWLRPKGVRVAFTAAAVYAFNPATILDLAVWGQWDSLYTVFMVASLMAVLKKRFGLSGVLLALAVLAKPQGVLLLPVIAYVLLREGGLKRAARSALAAGIVVLAVIAPFQGASNPIGFIAERYLGGYNVYKETSLNAYNFWAMAGMRASDQAQVMGLSLQSWGWLGFLAVAGYLMWLLHRRYPKTGTEAEVRERLVLQVAFLTVFAFFMVSTRIHERYLFPTLALLVMAWPRNRFLYFALTGAYLFNLVYVLYNLNSGVFVIQDWTIPVVVAFNGGLFFWAIRRFWRDQRAPSPKVLESV